MGQGRRIKGGGGGKGGPKGKSATGTGATGKGNDAALKGPSGAPSTDTGGVIGAAALSASSKRMAEVAEATAIANKAQAQRAAAEGDFFPKLRQKIGTILQGLLVFFFKRDYPIAHYVALFLVIIFLIYGFSFLVIRSTKKRKDKKKKSFWERIFGYRIGNAFQRISGVQPVTDPRPISNGRCDNIDFIEKRMGAGGVCVNNKLPEPLKWIIDETKIPELKELPSTIINKVTNDRAKYTVTIPWKDYGMVYMPDCGSSNVVFADGTPAYLLVDGGSFCKKVEVDKDPSTYKSSKSRFTKDHKPNRPLNVYIEDKNVLKDYIETVTPGEVCSIEEANELGIFDEYTFYEVGYDTLRSYNKDIDGNNRLTYRLCTVNTINEEASVLCPLVKNAGIGFTAKPGNKCVTAECPTGFTEDKTDPTICKKPIKERVVQLNSRNDEQYDDWYTIPNYHLGNKFGSSNNVHYAPCPSGSIPYYTSDPTEDAMAEENSTEQLGVCIDKDLFLGGKYAGTADYCPVSLIKRVGSTQNELLDHYLEVSNNDTVPDSVKQKISKLVEGIKSDDFQNLSLLSEEMELACNNLNKTQDYAKLKEAYVICKQLATNEPGFEAKFAGEPESLIKLRKDAAKYSCQQLFGVPPEERSNPNAVNKNADTISEKTLNFPGVDQIQFDQYIQAYDNETREKEEALPVISAEGEKKMFVDAFKSKTLAGVVWLTVVILVGYVIYYNRDRIGNFINCYVLNYLIWFINLFKTVTILPRECKSDIEMTQQELQEKELKIQAQEQKKKLQEQQKEAAEGPKAKDITEQGKPYVPSLLNRYKE